MAYNTETSFASPFFGDRVASLRDAWAEKLAKRKLYNKTLAELDSLSNRDLADLGMSRSTIKSVALEAVYGK